MARERAIGDVVLLWVFLAVGREREREVADGGEKEGAGGCEERGRERRKER